MWRAAAFVTLFTALFWLIGTSTLVQAQPYPGKDSSSKGRLLSPAKQGELEKSRDPQNPARPAHERMSPEDRRQLRRDIDQHGRELYNGKNR